MPYFQGTAIYQGRVVYRARSYTYQGLWDALVFHTTGLLVDQVLVTSGKE